MAKKLPGSKFGEGVGGRVQVTDDPNNPTFDPASRETGTDKKIRAMLEPAVAVKLSAWELEFLTTVYGAERLTPKQHIRVAKLHKKMLSPEG